MKPNKPVNKLLFVIQRYGLEVDGGAELYARWLAEHLRPAFNIEVLTTCATNYITWKNDYPEGRTELNGIPVIRCEVDIERDIQSFNRLTESILLQPRTMNQELEWLNAQGPVSSSLIGYLENNKDSYSAIIFFTYLYYPTVQGIQIEPTKSILIPTAHDEPVAKFSIFHDLYENASGFLYLTSAEREFVLSTYNVKHKPQMLLGTGVDIPYSNLTSSWFKKKYQIESPMILYIGRIETGKGCVELIEYYREFSSKGNRRGTLVLAGKNNIGSYPDNNIIFTGFIPDNEIKPALESADVIVVPSPFESLSILLLQGFSIKKPVLVNAKSSVLTDHCLASNGGLCYNNKNEFFMSLDLLLSRPDICNELGNNGKKYIERDYNWSNVISKFTEFITLWSSDSNESFRLT